jgi:hypothetical protein
LRRFYICNIAAFILNQKITYRKRTAVLFLVITVLLAAPLKQLHSHCKDSKNLPTAQTTVTSHCSICSFDFSPANADAIQYFVSAKPNYYIFPISNYSNAEEVVVENLSNKSPPPFL